MCFYGVEVCYKSTVFKPFYAKYAKICTNCWKRSGILDTRIPTFCNSAVDSVQAVGKMIGDFMQRCVAAPANTTSYAYQKMYAGACVISLMTHTSTISDLVLNTFSLLPWITA